MKCSLDIFKQLQDPRSSRNQKHLFIDIIILAVCGILCGAENWVEVAFYAECRKDFFAQFLALPNGIPSHDTFNLLFRKLNPESFNKYFMEWAKALSEKLAGKVIAFDGKTLCCASKCIDTPSPFHLVSAFVADNQLTLGQIKVKAKSNEITAMPVLLQLLDVEGAIITADAMSCQKEITHQIIEKKADYILSVKGNQVKLKDEIENYFKQAIEADLSKETHCDEDMEVEKNRGRVETRRVIICKDIDWLPQKEQWNGLNTIVCICSKRWIKGKETNETRYYISSLETTAQQMGRYIRSHWSIENTLHWSLDVAFNEDKSKHRKDHGAENFALLRKITMNLLKQDQTVKAGIKAKRLGAGWDPAYMLRILGVA